MCSIVSCRMLTNLESNIFKWVSPPVQSNQITKAPKVCIVWLRVSHTHTAHKDNLRCSSYLLTCPPLQDNLRCSSHLLTCPPLLLCSSLHVLFYSPDGSPLFPLLMSRVITVGPGQREWGRLRRRRQNRRREGGDPAESSLVLQIALVLSSSLPLSLTHSPTLN